MKTHYLLFLITIFTLNVINSDSLFAQGKKNDNNKEVVFVVENMNCKNCQATIEKYIPFEKGVKDLKCDLKNKRVTVTYDTKKTSVEKLQVGFNKIKFPAVVAPVDDESKKDKK
jgi:Copper chaperone